MCQSDDDEKYVLDSCVVIDFCGRTDNLGLLMRYVGQNAVITTAVRDELQRNRRLFSRLADFFESVERGDVEVIDPDLTDEAAARVIAKWSSCFGLGEVSSAALAVSRRWIFVSRDLEPMRQFRLTETLIMETTADILASLVRRGVISTKQSALIEKSILQASPRRRGR